MSTLSPVIPQIRAIIPVEVPTSPFARGAIVVFHSPAHAAAYLKGQEHYAVNGWQVNTLDEKTKKMLRNLAQDTQVIAIAPDGGYLELHTLLSTRPPAGTIGALRDQTTIDAFALDALHEHSRKRRHIEEETRAELVRKTQGVSAQEEERNTLIANLQLCERRAEALVADYARMQSIYEDELKARDRKYHDLKLQFERKAQKLRAERDAAREEARQRCAEHRKTTKALSEAIDALNRVKSRLEGVESLSRKERAAVFESDMAEAAAALEAEYLD